jgi:hemoglobin
MAATATQTARAQAPQPSLYERLGGVYNIATVVDDFIERLLVNATLNANPAIKEARTRVPKAGLKFQVTALVCEVSGGPCKYTGRTMKESHAKLNISQAEWDAMVVDFKATLNKFKVPQKEQQELITIVGTTEKDIVRSSSGD